MDVDVQVRHNINIPLKILRNNQHQELVVLASMLDEYQKESKEKMKQSSACYQLKQQTQAKIHTYEPEFKLAFDEQNGWNFQKSVQKAEK